MNFEDFLEVEEDPSYECPLCGEEVDEPGYCGYCKENMEEDDY